MCQRFQNSDTVLVEAHQHSHAYGYVRVAGEVGIYLEGIAEEGGEILEG